MTDERREQILAANKAMADQALRVLALSSRTYTEKPSDFSPEALEHDLVFCGLSGMIDPSAPSHRRHRGGQGGRHPRRHDHR